MPQVRVGISGWRYAGWRGNFYPKGLPQREELAYAASRFSSLEINGTFYSLQLPSSFAQWYDQTPRGFRFAVKGGRYITHFLKLKAVEKPLANFFASGLLLLREKLGPILWQFPPHSPFDPDRFEAFLDLLPRTTTEAARLARTHDDKVEGRTWLKADALRPIRHAVEVRHPSYFTPAFITLLRRYQVAFVIADVASKWPTSEDITAPFLYLRLHGSRQLYVSGYTPRELDHWAARVLTWTQGAQPPDARTLTPPLARAAQRDAYVYFDNTDIKLRAPIDAANFDKRIEKLQAAAPPARRRSA